MGTDIIRHIFLVSIFGLSGYHGNKTSYVSIFGLSSLIFILSFSEVFSSSLPHCGNDIA